MKTDSISKNIPETPALLVVGGTQRGGTTLLMRFLLAHPAINLFPFEQRSLRFYDLATFLHVIAVSKLLFASFSRLSEREMWRYTANYVLQILKQTSILGFVTLDTIHHAMVGALANRDTKYVGAKCPTYLLDYPQFIHRENTKCIFIYRDARDFTASNLMRVRYDWWRNRRWVEKFNTVEKLSRYWLFAMRCIQDLQQLEANVLIIRYEYFVSRPEATAERIAEYLRLDVDGFDVNEPSTSSIGKYKETLTVDEIAVIEDITGDTMRQFGYL